MNGNKKMLVEYLNYLSSHSEIGAKQKKHTSDFQKAPICLACLRLVKKTVDTNISSDESSRGLWGWNGAGMNERNQNKKVITSTCVVFPDSFMSPSDQSV